VRLWLSSSKLMPLRVLPLPLFTTAGMTNSPEWWRGPFHLPGLVDCLGVCHGSRCLFLLGLLTLYKTGSGRCPKFKFEVEVGLAAVASTPPLHEHSHGCERRLFSQSTQGERSGRVHSGPSKCRKLSITRMWVAICSKG